jgi:hypothetical protein
MNCEATMSFTHDTGSTRVYTDRSRHRRPSFSSHVTSDRLREGERASSIPKSRSNIKPQRKSVFKEEGLDDMNRQPHGHSKTPSIAETSESKQPKVTFEHILKDLEHRDRGNEETKKSLLSKFKSSRPTIKTATSAPPGLFPTIPRAALIVLLICVIVPGFRYSGGGIGGADADVIRASELVENGSVIEGRQNSPTSICTRWSHQSRFQA